MLLEPNEEKRITGRLLKRANLTQDQNDRLALGFHLNPQGAFLFTQLTTEYRPRKDGSARRLAIVLEEKVHSAPVIRSPIGADGIIEGRFSQKQLENLVNVLNAGVLPEQRDKGPTDVQSNEKVTLEIKDWKETQALVAAQKGKIVVLDVPGPTSCDPCVTEFPHLVELHKKFGADVACISMSCDYAGIKKKPPEFYRERVLKFLQEAGGDVHEYILSNVPADRAVRTDGHPCHSRGLRVRTRRQTGEAV